MLPSQNLSWPITPSVTFCRASGNKVYAHDCQCKIRPSRPRRTAQPPYPMLSGTPPTSRRMIPETNQQMIAPPHMIQPAMEYPSVGRFCVTTTSTNPVRLMVPSIHFPTLSAVDISIGQLPARISLAMWQRRKRSHNPTKACNMAPATIGGVHRCANPKRMAAAAQDSMASLILISSIAEQLMYSIRFFRKLRNPTSFNKK